MRGQIFFRSASIVRGKQRYKNPVRLFIIVIACHIISRFYEKREKLKNMIYPRMIDSKNRQTRRSISRRFMRIVKQMQKVFSNGYKGIVQYKSLVCHPHVNLVATTRSRRPSRSLSAGQGILTFVFFLLSLSFGPCLEVRRCLAAACHSFSCDRLSGLSSPSLRR